MAAEEKQVETPAETPAVDGELKEPPKVARPSRDKINEQQAQMAKEQSVLEDKIQALVAKRKSMQTKGDSAPVAAAKAKFKELKVKQNGLQEQRKALFAVRDAAKANRDEKMAEMKDLKSQTKYKSVEEIDRKIKQLETAQSTTSMTLTKEKEVLKEIDELKKQRKLVAQVSGVAAALDGGKAVDNSATIKEVLAQLDEVKKEIEGVKKVLDKDEASKKDDPSKKLTEEINLLRDQKKAISDKIQDMWNKFRKDQDAWRENQKAWDAFKKVRDAAKKKEYEARMEAAKKARAEELAKKTPYEEEMDLCDYLGNYLSTTFLKAGAAAGEETKSGDKPAPAAALPEGFVPMKGKFGDTDMYLAGNGASSKALKKKGGKKGPAGTKGGKVVLMPETIESFSLLKMLPPTTLEAVAATVDELKKKKEAFKTMPRGEIKSIAEMNQELEDEAEKRRNQRRDDKGEGGGKGGGGGKKGGANKKLDVTSTELFPSLGGN